MPEVEMLSRIELLKRIVQGVNHVWQGPRAMNWLRAIAWRRKDWDQTEGKGEWDEGWIICNMVDGILLVPKLREACWRMFRMIH